MSDHDPFDLTTQTDKRQTADDQARNAQRVERDDIIWLMSGKRGRRVAHRMLDRAGVWRLSFSTNALQMAFNEGTRASASAIDPTYAGLTSLMGSASSFAAANYKKTAATKGA